jgi:hypothetical protein
MKIATVLTLIFSFQGYWFGGQDAHLHITPAVQMPDTPATLKWEIALGSVKLGHGEVPFNLNEKSADLVIRAPAVDRRTDLKFSYTVTNRAGDKILQTGDSPIHLFPDAPLAIPADASAGKTIVVVDNGDEILAACERSAIKPVRIKNASRLPLMSPDVVIIAPGAFSKEIGDSLVEQIQKGASAILFAQPAGESVNGYNYAARQPPVKFRWQTTHPLFRDLAAEDLESLSHFNAKELVCLQLPPDAPALVLASWPHEIKVKEPNAVDPIAALMMTQTIGRGRLVVCQLSSLDWKSDPRAQILLRNSGSPREPLISGWNLPWVGV